MKKNLLCFALVLAMAVTMTAMVFAPNVSALEEWTGEFRVTLQCSPDRLSYGDSLWYVFHLSDDDGKLLYMYVYPWFDDQTPPDWYLEDPEYWEGIYVECWNAPVTLTLFDESGKAVWADDSRVVKNFWIQDSQPLDLDIAEMRAWKSGEYTFRVEVTVRSVTQYVEKTFYFTGYEDALGDINGNGQIEATDYLLLKRYCLGTFRLADWQKAVADINGDGSINALDYMLLKRHVLGTYKIA